MATNDPVETDTIDIRYSLPLTRLSVTAQLRDTLNIVMSDDPLQAASTYVVQQPSTSMTPRVVADPGPALRLRLSGRLLEKKSVTLALDTQRVITGFNASLSRDLAPVLDAVTAIVPLVATFTGGGAGRKVEGRPSLEDGWRDQNADLANVLEGLAQRLPELLAALGRERDPAAIVGLGQAIAVITHQMSAIDTVRREWIAGHAKVIDELTLDLDIFDTVEVLARHLEGGRLPAVLPAGLPLPAGQQELASKYRTLVVVNDPEFGELRESRRGDAADPSSKKPVIDTVDAIRLRYPRMVQIAIYVRDFDPGEAAGPVVAATGDGWNLQAGTLSRITFVDELSVFYSMSLSASWFQERKLDLSMHPDQSFKSYGTTRESTIGSALTSAGGLLGSTAPLFEKDKPPTANQVAIDQAMAKVELLKASSDLTRLANRFGLKDELALAETLVRIADSR